MKALILMLSLAWGAAASVAGTTDKPPEPTEIAAKPTTTTSSTTSTTTTTTLPPPTVPPAYTITTDPDYGTVISADPFTPTINWGIPVDWARWLRLHQCEQANSWYANGGNPADPAGQTFQGGLGMSTVAWDMGVTAAAARGIWLPESALFASPEQQMVGAQTFYDRHGWGWSCRV